MTRALLALLAATGLVACLSVRHEAPDAGTESPAAAAGEAAPADAGAAAYVGSDQCGDCHADETDNYLPTVHARVLAGEDRPPADRGCEACHGPGGTHVDEGGGEGVGGLRTFRDPEPPQQRSAACLRCHAGAGQRHDWRRDAHALAGVPCTGCHQPHGGVGEALLARTPPQLCYDCHQDVRAQFALPEHHKVDEGVVSCLDCHNPHGSRNLASLRDANRRTCLQCHGDYEGPFVFEHVGLVTEGCMGCHEPHGSPNRHLLIRQQVAQVCYQCHTVTPRDHVQPSFRDCTRCHVGIHGSNVDAFFLSE